MSTWISPPSLGSNGLYCIKCQEQVRKLLLNLTPSEPLALAKKLLGFDNPIELDVLLLSALHLCIHDLINGRMFQTIKVELCWCQLLCYI